MADGKNRAASTFIVTVSVLLQLAAIGSPGWLIEVHGNTEVFKSIFYKITCTTLHTTDCDAKTYYTMYKEKRDALKLIAGTKVVQIQQDKELYDDILDMVLILAALLCTCIILITQIFRTCNTDKRYNRVVTASPALLTFAAGLMASVFSKYLITTHHMSEMRSFDKDRDHTYMGLPYSVAMYIGAFLLNILTAFLQTCQITGSQKKVRPKKRMYDDDEVRAAPAPTKLPVIQTTTIEEPSELPEKKPDVSYDNPTFSVKL